MVVAVTHGGQRWKNMRNMFVGRLFSVEAVSSLTELITRPVTQVAVSTVAATVFCAFVGQSINELKAGMRELKAEMKDEMKEMKDEMKEMKGEMKDEMKEMKDEMKEMKSELKAEMMEIKSELKAEMGAMKVVMIFAVIGGVFQMGVAARSAHFAASPPTM